MTCYAGHEGETACGAFARSGGKSRPPCTTSVYEVTCNLCRQVLAIKGVGIEDKLFKQDDPRMQAGAILGAIQGEIISMELGTTLSKEKLDRLNSFIKQLKQIHSEYLPLAWV